MDEFFICASIDGRSHLTVADHKGFYEFIGRFVVPHNPSGVGLFTSGDQQDCKYKKAAYIFHIYYGLR